MLRSYIGKTDVTDYTESIDNATKPVDGDAMMAGTAADWVSESHRLAASVAYAGVSATDETHLTDQYVSAARPSIEKQLERGGVRLAMVLNRAWGK